MKKILAITSIRSDYDLMSGLYQLLHNDPDIDLQLIVSGAHLSPTFGNTVEFIKKDGYNILLEIESLIHSDTPKSRLKTASIFLQNAIDVVAAWQPDVILYAGDREDVLVGGMLGTFLGIPTVHVFGGDHEKDGHADTLLRHATSKLSTFHIVSIDQHKLRLIKMGESSKRIFVAGNMALDRFAQLRNKTTPIPTSIFPANKNLADYAMVIYHPIGGENAGETFESILLTLKKLSIPAIISYPNTDPDHQAIIERIHHYEDDPQFWFYKNIERDVFLSLYKNARFLIGNSSSGILEAASLPLGVINVGKRQTERLCGNNVVFCTTQKEDIEQAIQLVVSPQFTNDLDSIRNPHGDGQSCQKVYSLIKTTDFATMLKKIEDPLEMS